MLGFRNPENDALYRSASALLRKISSGVGSVVVYAALDLLALIGDDLTDEERGLVKLLSGKCYLALARMNVTSAVSCLPSGTSEYARASKLCESLAVVRE